MNTKDALGMAAFLGLLGLSAYVVAKEEKRVNNKDRQNPSDEEKVIGSDLKNPTPLTDDDIEKEQGFIMKNFIPSKDLIGKEVWVYYNLHKDTFSIRYKGKVVHWADAVKMKDVRFCVSEKAMRTIMNDPKHKKVVHAYVVGKVESIDSYKVSGDHPDTKRLRPTPFEYKQTLKYNPLDGKPYFSNAETNEKVDSVPRVEMLNYYFPSKNRMRPSVIEPK